MNQAEPSLFPAPHVGLISVGGADATEFLQAQLSRRLDTLTPDTSALAGWHDARGRVRAVFRIVVTSEGYLLIGPGELITGLLTALRMFVLRKRVSIDVAPLVCGGVLAATSEGPAVAPAGLPPLPLAQDAVTAAGAVIAVAIASRCWYLIGPADALRLPASAQHSPIAAAEIRSGLPQVDSVTTAQYVPHMLNLDRLGALDFEKGCYPGQEIIARTQHLGTVKRRACGFACAVAAPPASAAPILDDRGERIGEVLRAAADIEGRVVLLGVVALDALTRRVFLGEPDGPRLERFALPYEVAPAAPG